MYFLCSRYVGKTNIDRLCFLWSIYFNFQIKRDALFGGDGAQSVKRKKIFPSAETPCTSPAEPIMAEDARPGTSSGGPAGIETPNSSSMSLDCDVSPVSVPTGLGGEAETAG